MRTRQLIAAAVLLLWASASRSPAPIIEEQQSPPTTEQSSKQKVRRRTTTPKTDSSQTKSRNPAASALQGPARFAGIWTGEIKQGLLGRVTASFTVSPDAISVQMSQNMGGGTHPATINGNTLSWSTGTFSATANLTPNSDGQTAQFLLKGMFGSTMSTMRRAAGFTPPAPSSSSQTPPPITQSNANTPGYDTVALRPSGSMSGPKPELPAELHGQNLTGRGVYLMHFDKPTGNLIDVTVSQSTGSTVLDQAAIATLRQWHATPGCPREVPFTVTYSVTGP
jgi:TonB family protein